MKRTHKMSVSPSGNEMEACPVQEVLTFLIYLHEY